MAKERPITIVIDTREQRPYEFADTSLGTTRKALPAGDYSIVGFETDIAVERKSIDDFAQSVVKNRDRFNAELDSLRSYAFACVVVEGSMADVAAGRYASGASPSSVFAAMVSIIVDSAIPVFFCSDRPTARKFVEEFLRRAARRLSECEPNQPDQQTATE